MSIENLDFTGKRVMDIGCGHGLLGIYALNKNPKYVLFQDFNEEVLNIATKKNILLN